MQKEHKTPRPEVFGADSVKKNRCASCGRFVGLRQSGFNLACRCACGTTGSIARQARAYRLHNFSQCYYRLLVVRSVHNSALPVRGNGRIG